MASLTGYSLYPKTINGINSTTSDSVTTTELTVSDVSSLKTVIATTISTTSLTSTSIGGTLTTATQPNITSVGTLTGLNVIGDSQITGIFATIGANVEICDPTFNSILYIIPASKNGVSNGNYVTYDIIGSGNTHYFVDNLETTGSFTAPSITCSGNISGTLTTASQPNITSVGTLTSLAMSSSSSVTWPNGDYIRSFPAGGGLVIYTNTNSNKIFFQVGIYGSVFTIDKDKINLPYYTGEIQIGGVTVLNQSTLGSSVTASSLTSLGTLSSLTVGGTISQTSGSATLQNLTLGNITQTPNVKGGGSTLASCNLIGTEPTYASNPLPNFATSSNSQNSFTFSSSYNSSTGAFGGFGTATGYTNAWTVPSGLYSLAGAYTGTTTTSFMALYANNIYNTPISIKGEWLQIGFPSSQRVSTIAFTLQNLGAFALTTRYANTINILGSNDNNGWYSLVQGGTSVSISANTGSANQSITLWPREGFSNAPSSFAFKFYRFIFPTMSTIASGVAFGPTICNIQTSATRSYYQVPQQCYYLPSGLEVGLTSSGEKTSMPYVPLTVNGDAWVRGQNFSVGTSTPPAQGSPFEIYLRGVMACQNLCFRVSSTSTTSVGTTTSFFANSPVVAFDNTPPTFVSSNGYGFNTTGTYAGMYRVPVGGMYHVNFFIRFADTATTALAFKPCTYNGTSFTYMIGNDNAYWLASDPGNRRNGSYCDIVRVEQGNGICALPNTATAMSSCIMSISAISLDIT